jgi:hypothetical protein
VITDLGVMRPDRQTFELVLTGIYAGVCVEQVRDSTGWDLKVSAELTQIAPPTEAELGALREMVAAASAAPGPSPAAGTPIPASTPTAASPVPASPAALGVGE